jgi:hypothetical protein
MPSLDLGDDVRGADRGRRRLVALVPSAAACSLDCLLHLVDRENAEADR